MYAKIHPTIAVHSHPKHQAYGGYFIAPYQREEQRTRHCIGGMTAHKTVSTTLISVYQMQYTF
jgi:hypothetical protein